MQNKEKTFEEYLAMLDSVVRNLENKEISLEDAVSNYTKGIELSKKCFDILSKNEELVVEQMTKNGLQPFKQE